MTPSAEDRGPTKEGDLVLLDYEIWAEGGGRTELVDTTRAEVAQSAGVTPPEGHEFAPQPHLVGGDYFPAGVEAALVGMPIGDEVAKEFAPAEAYGERDPKLIELFTMHEIERLPEMRRENAELEVGTVLNIRGRRGRVVTLTAARVRVDFNPPFAGRKLRAKFKATERIVEPGEKARALVDLTYGRGKEFGVEVHGETVTLKVPDRAKFDLNWLAAKPRVIERVRTQLKPGTIKLVEEYVTPAGKKASGEGGKETAAAEGEKPAAESKGHHKGTKAAEHRESAPGAEKAAPASTESA